MRRPIQSFDWDDEGDPVAILACGHRQHVRHDPPWQERPWVLTEEGRAGMVGEELDCRDCEMPALPSEATVYKKTKVFDAASTPQGLLSEHRTKEGTWGRIVVLEGRLVYTIFEPEEESWVLSPERPGIIRPTQLHRVAPKAPCRFVVEFLREPEGGEGPSPVASDDSGR